MGTYRGCYIYICDVSSALNVILNHGMSHVHQPYLRFTLLGAAADLAGRDKEINRRRAK